MSVLMSPNDNTGWGVGYMGMRATGMNRMRRRRKQQPCGSMPMRATGTVFNRNHPVRVKAHYRAQWGQRNGRKTAGQLSRGFKRYRKGYRERLAAWRKKNPNKKPKRSQVAAAKLSPNEPDTAGPSTGFPVLRPRNRIRAPLQ